MHYQHSVKGSSEYVLVSSLPSNSHQAHFHPDIDPPLAQSQVLFAPSFCGCDECKEEAAVDDEDVEDDGDEDGPMAVAINTGESGEIGPMLRTRISISTESARKNKQERKKKREKRPDETYHQTVHSPTTAPPSSPNSNTGRSIGHRPSSSNRLTTIESGREIFSFTFLFPESQPIPSSPSSSWSTFSISLSLHNLNLENV